MATAEDWKCPICFDLLYKPCVNVCGHVFCFWCMHQAMNPYRPSQCPVCRSVYSRFPKVCEVLHCYLARAFPEDYDRRVAETKEDEIGWGYSSPECTVDGDKPANPCCASGHSVQSPDLNQGAYPRNIYQPTEHDFLCANPSCGQLLHEPCVLSCGHVVCQTCMPKPVRCEAAESSSESGCSSSGGASSSSPTSNVGRCPCCATTLVPNTSTCMKLADLLKALFPQQYAQRAHQLQAAADEAGRADTSSTTQSRTSPESPAPDPKRAKQALLEALRQQCGGDHGALLARLKEEVRRNADVSFTWYMMGCDDCGVYPIVGRRYRCRHCPEKIGYDLCGECYDRGKAGRGRFNQNHRPDHVLDKVCADLDWSSPRDTPQLVSWVNMLEALHPELSVEQIMSLTIMQLPEPIDAPPSSSAEGQGPPTEGSGWDTTTAEDEEFAAAAAYERQRRQQHTGFLGGSGRMCILM